MPRLGNNGGLMGLRRVPSAGSASGVWDCDEQSLARRAGIWPSTLGLGDPYWNNVTRLYSFSGETITDLSLTGSDPTLVNDVQIVSNQSPFSGSQSAYFNGTTSYIEIPTINLNSSEDFTVEFWMYPEISTIHTILIQNNYNFVGHNRIIIDNFNRFVVADNNFGPIVALGGWHHLAFVRNNNNETGYVDGVGYTYGSAGARSYGRIGNVDSGYWFVKGWLSNMRITSGIARYTSDFTPPTEPFPTFPAVPT